MSDVRLFTVPSDAAQNDVRLLPANLYGALGVTLENLTLISEGTAPSSGISGSLSVTLDALTLSSSGALGIAGTEATTLAALTLSSAGTLALKGALSVTLSDVTLTSDGTIEGAAPEQEVQTRSQGGVDPYYYKKRKKKQPEPVSKDFGDDWQPPKPRPAIPPLAAQDIIARHDAAFARTQAAIVAALEQYDRQRAEAEALAAQEQEDEDEAILLLMAA